MKQYLFVIVGIITIVVLLAAGGGQISPPYSGGGGGGAPIASPTFTGIATAPTFNYTTSLTQSGTIVHASNGCTATVAAPASTTATCTIALGTSSSICTYSPSNALAQALMSDGISTANVSWISITGTTVTLHLNTTSGIATPAGGETFTVTCTV